MLRNKGKDEGQSNSQASSYILELYEKEILHMLTEIVKNVPNYNHDAENFLSKEHNAFIVRNTKKYHRAMIKRSSASQNIRDEQAISTIEQHMKFRGKDAKNVWEHSTHIGDAHATDMASEGMVNVVQLLREQHVNYGVGYNPEHEKFGKDVPTILPKSYSDFIFLNETSELHPEHTQSEGNQIPETYPFGM